MADITFNSAPVTNLKKAQELLKAVPDGDAKALAAALADEKNEALLKSLVEGGKLQAVYTDEVKDKDGKVTTAGITYLDMRTLANAVKDSTAAPDIKDLARTVIPDKVPLTGTAKVTSDDSTTPWWAPTSIIAAAGAAGYAMFGWLGALIGGVLGAATVFLAPVVPKTVAGFFDQGPKTGEPTPYTGRAVDKTLKDMGTQLDATNLNGKLKDNLEKFTNKPDDTAKAANDAVTKLGLTPPEKAFMLQDSDKNLVLIKGTVDADPTKFTVTGVMMYDSEKKAFGDAEKPKDDAATGKAPVIDLTELEKPYNQHKIIGQLKSLVTQSTLASAGFDNTNLYEEPTKQFKQSQREGLGGTAPFGKPVAPDGPSPTV